MLGTPVKPERAIERRIGNPRWVKGVSANPGRRPAVVRELRDGAQAEGLNCIQTLIKIRDNEDFPPITRIAAQFVGSRLRPAGARSRDSKSAAVA
jgi:hypothetical protein